MTQHDGPLDESQTYNRGQLERDFEKLYCAQDIARVLNKVTEWPLDEDEAVAVENRLRDMKHGVVRP